MMTETEIEKLTEEITKTINVMRKEKLLSPKSIMQHIGKNRARLREIGEGLNQANCLTLTIDMIPEAKKLLIWNTYLEMELERKTKISCDVRWNRR